MRTIGVFLAGLVAVAAHASAWGQPVCPLPVGGLDYETLSLKCMMERIERRDDPLEETVSTTSMLMINPQLDGEVEVDTGFSVIQLRGKDAARVAWMFWTRSEDRVGVIQVNHGAPLRVLEAATGRSDLKCGRLPCQFWENSSATLTDAAVRELLAGPEMIAFRLIGRRGDRVDGTVRRAELEAVLIVAGLGGRFGLAAPSEAPEADRGSCEIRGTCAGDAG